MRVLLHTSGFVKIKKGIVEDLPKSITHQYNNRISIEYLSNQLLNLL